MSAPWFGRHLGKYQYCKHFFYLPLYSIPAAFCGFHACSDNLLRTASPWFIAFEHSSISLTLSLQYKNINVLLPRLTSIFSIKTVFLICWTFNLSFRGYLERVNAEWHTCHQTSNHHFFLLSSSNPRLSFEASTTLHKAPERLVFILNKSIDETWYHMTSWTPLTPQACVVSKHLFALL